MSPLTVVFENAEICVDSEVWARSQIYNKRAECIRWTKPWGVLRRMHFFGFSTALASQEVIAMARCPTPILPSEDAHRFRLSAPAATPSPGPSGSRKRGRNSWKLVFCKLRTVGFVTEKENENVFFSTKSCLFTFRIIIYSTQRSCAIFAAGLCCGTVLSACALAETSGRIIANLCGGSTDKYRAPALREQLFMFMKRCRPWTATTSPYDLPRGDSCRIYSKFISYDKSDQFKDQLVVGKRCRPQTMSLMKIDNWKLKYTLSKLKVRFQEIPSVEFEVYNTTVSNRESMCIYHFMKDSIAKTFDLLSYVQVYRNWIEAWTWTIEMF